MKIKIVLSYDKSETMAQIWATDEDSVDFRRDQYNAARCTAAFAALELRDHLERTLFEPDIGIASSKSGQDFDIELKMIDIESDDAVFFIEPEVNGILICGKGRKGLLYGIYEFLRMQGWRWYAPGRTGEIAPSLQEKLLIPEVKKEYLPSMNLGRGFDFEYLSMESDELYLWMARNRMDMVSYRPLTGPLCRKLGMSFKNGGHIFEAILNPERIMPSGKILWEEHECWYGLPPDGIRKKDQALQTQFCVSQFELVEFLGEELLSYLSGKWKEADRVDIWGFDTWGSGCCCEGCRKLGNGSDRTLYFLSQIRRIVDLSVKSGRLDHNVRLVMCVYEGTSTIEAPVKPIPVNLIESGDYGVFYPIRRCYAHDFSDGSCTGNNRYADALKGWFAHSPSLPLMIGEYYNVSKFEDLPLLFSTRISNDIPFYYSSGARGMTYMHVPMVNWGMRTLTQLLYAQLIWDADTDVPAFIDEYFTDWYGPQAGNAANVYELVEEAWLLSANWRAWGNQSILTQLQMWDGRRPETPLKTDDHFKSTEGAIKRGRKSTRLMYKALEIVNGMIRAEQEKARLVNPGNDAAAVNPAELRNLEINSRYEMRLSEDRRLLLYGLDTMKIMTFLVEYHNALYMKDDKTAARAWEKIERLADNMDSYFIPISFNWPGTGLDSRDALSRTQVRELLARIRSSRRNFK